LQNLNKRGFRLYYWDQTLSLESDLAIGKCTFPALLLWGQALSPGNVLFLPFAPMTFIWIRPDPGELRSHREEQMENSVKNLIGSEAVSQNLLKKRQIKTQVLQV